MFSRHSVQIAALFSDVFGQALPNLCRSFYNETKAEMFFSVFAVALLAEGVDRNMSNTPDILPLWLSPSSRRAWIEISLSMQPITSKRSPSSRRAWIEITMKECRQAVGSSPSSRRAWIEIKLRVPVGEYQGSPSSRRAWIEILFVDQIRRYYDVMSPSSRRAWIEMP